ncbi:hypothetical protein, partial [Atlantibacter hermannii]|uniref:hypothetical protein n=1 Tax=Atlantibacter hermannii TaxID=565 RepID=UPI001EE41A83
LLRGETVSAGGLTDPSVYFHAARRCGEGMFPVSHSSAVGSLAFASAFAASCCTVACQWLMVFITFSEIVNFARAASFIIRYILSFAPPGICRPAGI